MKKIKVFFYYRLLCKSFLFYFEELWLGGYFFRFCLYIFLYIRINILEKLFNFFVSAY